MNYTFKDSSIVSVNSGTIVLNVSGKTRTFVDAKLVSAVDGKIVLDLPEPIYKEGNYLVINVLWGERIFILSENTDIKVNYHVSTQHSGLHFHDFWYKPENKFRYATPEEIQELDDQLTAEGKYWSPATSQIENLRWKPKQGEIYFTIVVNGYGMYISEYTNGEDLYDKNNYKLGNCFKTKEEAEAKLEKIKKLLLEV